MHSDCRALVLVSDSAGHPFRQSLPRQVLVVEPELPAQPRLRITLTDLREFLMAYCACFLAVSAFIG